MTDQDHSPDRRDAIKTAGLGLGIGVGMGGGSGLGLLAAADAEGAPAAICSSEYWAKKVTKKVTDKGAVEFNLWRKRLGDLTVPGKASNSVMRSFLALPDAAAT